ncbi:hypothetical protein [Listeria costaricensis]|uniref:hypothetical protein n=1 Tax=Listeria costaricensis TaxID=2026604 RepID=UPI000C088A96|nr:hypothetical protein [Listeria costaricensis]
MRFRDTNQLDDIKQFMEEWYKNKPRVTDFCSTVKFPNRFPQMIVEYYQFLSNWGEVGGFGLQDYLVQPENLKEEDGRFRLIGENQDCFYIWVEACQKEPHIFSNAPALFMGATEEITPLPHSLAHLIKTFTLRELLFGAEKTACYFADQKVCLEGTYEPLWLEANYALPKQNDLDFWLVDQKILMMKFRNNGEFWVGSDAEVAWKIKNQ